ncbi:thioredoxin family protein [Archaeoglobus sp.]
MIVETTSEEFAKLTNGKLVGSRKPKTIIRNSREIVILGDVNKKRELFLKILKNIDDNCEIDAEVKIFIAPLCPVCPHVVENVCSLPIKKIEIIDVVDYPEIAEKYNVMATPTVIVGKVKLVGKVSKEEVLEWIRRGYDKKEYFAKLLREGEAEEVVRMVKEDGDASVLVELLTYKDFMVRLGAMVAIEELAKEHPEIVKKVKDKIRKLLKHEDERIRQDVAMLIGDIGDDSDKEFLEELLKDDNAEHLREAIDEIESRNQK